MIDLHRASALIVGGCTLASLLVSLPAALMGARRNENLSVVFSGLKPYELSRSGETRAVRVLPRDLMARLDRQGRLEGAGNGVWLRSWRATFGKQWEQEVSLPVVVGARDDNGPVCGYALRIGAAVLDPSRGAPALQTYVNDRVRSAWPEVQRSARSAGLALADVASVVTEVQLAAGYVSLGLKIHLEDGAGLNVAGKLSLGVNSGVLVPAFTHVEVIPNKILRDKARDAATSGFFGLVLNVLSLGWVSDYAEDKLKDRAHAAVTTQLQAAQAALADVLRRLGNIPSPIEERSEDSFRISFFSRPLVRPDGILLYPCVSARIARSGSLDPDIHGFPQDDLSAPGLAADADEDSVELAANRDALNQVLFVTWQTGLLRRLGKSLLSTDTNGIVEKLSFDVQGVDPRLPPFVSGAARHGSRLRVAAMNLHLGDWRDGRSMRQVFGHGVLVGHVRASSNHIVLSGGLEDVRANCVENALPNGFRLTPCLGDLVPVARLEFAAAPKKVNFNATTWFEQLEAYGGSAVRIKVDRLSGETTGGGIYARARIRVLPGTR